MILRSTRDRASKATFAQALTRNIPVIVVTGQLAESMEGAACLRRKPVSPDRLVNTVRACITAGGAAEPG